jgi:type IV pilus assembly protein PilY1
MNSINSYVQKTIAISLMVCLTTPSYAVLGLLNVPPQSVTPPVPNVVVTLDDSGSMQTDIPFDPTINYVIPPNSNGLSRANGGGQPRAYNNGYNNQNNVGDVNLATENSWIPLTVAPWGNNAKNIFNSLATVDEKQNFANYYGYYRDRNLMMKASVLRAFSPQVIPDGRFRLAWQTLGDGGSKCGGFTNTSGCTNNRLSALEGSHRDNFFSWVRGVPADTYTPLREAYQRVGQYMQTTGLNGAFAHRPGLTEAPVLSCRRSYHVLATDGGWNDNGNFQNSINDNASVTLPDGSSFTAQTPYRGASGSPGNNSLADLAFKYWATDLQTGLPNNVAPQIKKSGAEMYGSVSVAPYWNPKNNPSTWQNLTLYAIGLGEAGDLTPAATGYSAATVPTFTTDTTAGPSFAQIVEGTRNWPSVDDFNQRAFDLWHAAVNSRGAMFSAKRPDEIVSAFQKIVAEILASNAPTGGGSSSLSLKSDFISVRSGYEGAPTWRGVLQGFNQTNGTINATPLYDAGAALTAQSPTSRVIVTAKLTNQGVPFRSLSDLSVYQQAMLNRNIGGSLDANGQLRLDYLRGSRANETFPPAPIPSPEFRSRDNNILGTLVNSEPRIIGQPRSGFFDSSYKTFRDANVNRQKVIYVGANDGMLHGFNGGTGAAMLSYVPRGVFARLSAYTDPTYSHKYFVDGQVVPGDAFVDGAWKTFLFGSLGAGGKGFFGLDITDPSTFTESNAGNLVKFDYTAPSEALPAGVAGQFTSEQGGPTSLGLETATDLGHIMGDSSKSGEVGRSVQVSKMQNGKFAFVTGNGVNSNSEKAGLYIVYLDSGEGFKKLFPSNLSPAGAAAAGPDNGLSTPLLLDANGDGKIDTIYAGDLKGNLWKFVSDAAGNFSVGNAGAPLISVGKAIVSAPVATVHPRGGIFVSFGTGRLITVDDKTSTNTQTMYGVWDKPSTPGTVALNLLIPQVLSDAVASEDGQAVRSLVGPNIDYSTKRGWSINLTVPGERIVFNPSINGSLVSYSTLVPVEGTACSSGGQAGSTLYFNVITGKPPLKPAIDVNNDGVFDQKDKVAGGAGAVNTVAGIAIGVGKQVGFVKQDRGGGGKICRLLGTSGSPAVGCGEGPGRLLWRDMTP